MTVGKDAVELFCREAFGTQVGIHAVIEPGRDLARIIGEMLDTDLPAVTEVTDCATEAVMPEIRWCGIDVADLLRGQSVQSVRHTFRRTAQGVEVHPEAITDARPPVIRRLVKVSDGGSVCTVITDPAVGAEPHDALLFSQPRRYSAA